MSFEEKINRLGTHSVKWDMLEPLYGVDPKDGIAMWVADMDFRPPECVLDALRKMLDHGVFGYYGNDAPYREAICGWMKRRHNWHVDPSHIFTTHGLVNGTGLCLDAFTNEGDGVLMFTPIYHAFARVIKSANRELVEVPMPIESGTYQLDFDAAEAALTGRERMLIFCSPHNPGGRVWSADELRKVADFAKKHDLILVSDEIHHDLVFPGQKHIAMANAAPDISDRLVMMTAASKTFNIAGGHTGNVIISDETMHKKFANRMGALGLSPNNFGLVMTEAAYSGGDAWVDSLVTHLGANRAIFDAGMAEIPGVKSMNLQSTYLAWVDFRDTGMTDAEIIKRVQGSAKVVANHGQSFGAGGDGFLRFNLGAPTSVIRDAVARLQDAFADLQ